MMTMTGSKRTWGETGSFHSLSPLLNMEDGLRMGTA